MEKAPEEEEATVTHDDRDQSNNKELLEDRMKCIATEMEIEKEEQTTKKKKCKHQPFSDKEPTREHLLLRETHHAATKWEKDMRAKYMEGQVVEMLGKIMENVNNNTEFPPNSQPYHNWPKELMDHATIGWQKYKIFMETLKKYPMQNREQIYRDDTGELILLDRSGGASKGRKRKKNRRVGK